MAVANIVTTAVIYHRDTSRNSIATVAYNASPQCQKQYNCVVGFATVTALITAGPAHASQRSGPADRVTGGRDPAVRESLKTALQKNHGQE